MKIRTRDINGLNRRDSKAKITLLSILALTGVMAKPGFADCTPVLYGAAYAGSNGLATLYDINPATGQGVGIGAIGFERVSGMDIDPATGILYGAGERTGGSDTPVLIQIDRSTGAGTELWTMPNEEPIAGASIRNGDSLFFGYGGEEGLYSINITTGVASTIFTNENPDRSGNAVAFSSGDVLYHADGEDLHTVNQSTGALTTVANLIFYVPPEESPKVAAMDYAPESDTWYAIVKDDSEVSLATINISTGVVSKIGFTADKMDALAYYCIPSLEEEVYEDGFESG